MSFQNADQILELEGQTKNFTPEAAYSPPGGFLSLAPTVSQSYPKTQKFKLAANTAELATDVPIESIPEAANEVDAARSRTSSLSSDGKSLSSRRYLKLGPVHWGEHQEVHQADYHDVAVEE